MQFSQLKLLDQKTASGFFFENLPKSNADRSWSTKSASTRCRMHLQACYARLQQHAVCQKPSSIDVNSIEHEVYLPAFPILQQDCNVRSLVGLAFDMMCRTRREQTCGKEQCKDAKILPGAGTLPISHTKLPCCLTSLPTLPMT